MKLKLIAAALAMSSGAAFAGVNGDTALDLSGASAVQQNVARAVRALCNTAGGNITVFKEGAQTNVYRNWMAYQCSVPMEGGITLVRHTVDGGSLMSILAMNDATKVDFVNVASCSATGVAGTGDLAPLSVNPADPTGPALTNVRTGCTIADGDSDGGFSDVEWQLSPELFTAKGEEFMANVEVLPAFVGQAFGVAVSQNLYRALQAKQQADGLIDASCAAGDYTPACQPSLSRADVASLMNANEFSAAKAGVGALVGSSATDEVVYCRRPATSGTQTSAEVFFLGKSCVSGDLGGSVPVIAEANIDYGSYRVSVNSSTSNVRTCVNATSGYAFGIVSAENEPLASNQNWRFVKLDGVSVTEGTATATNRKTAVDGSYGYLFELVAHVNAADGVTGDEERALIDAISARLALPEAEGGFAARGLYQIRDGGYANAAYPDSVSKVQRGGATPNNCLPLMR